MKPAVHAIYELASKYSEPLSLLIDLLSHTTRAEMRETLRNNGKSE